MKITAKIAIAAIAAMCCHAGALSQSSQADVFGSAKWIGAESADVPLHPQSLTVYRIAWHVTPGVADAWVKFGIGDEHFTKRHLNIKHLASEPGFEHFVIKPQADTTGSITWTKGHYQSRNGLIESSWRHLGDGMVEYSFTIPEGTSATVILPGREAAEYTAGSHTVIA